MVGGQLGGAQSLPIDKSSSPPQRVCNTLPTYPWLTVCSLGLVGEMSDELDTFPCTLEFCCSPHPGVVGFGTDPQRDRI